MQVREEEIQIYDSRKISPLSSKTQIKAGKHHFHSSGEDTEMEMSVVPTFWGSNLAIFKALKTQ